MKTNILRKTVIIVALVAAFVCGVFICSVNIEYPFTNVTAYENYTCVKESNSGWEMGGGRTYTYLLHVKSKDAISDFCRYFGRSIQSDTYVYTEFFINDANDYAIEFAGAVFSDKSWRSDRTIGEERWRIILSEDKSYIYLQIICLS